MTMNRKVMLEKVYKYYGKESKKAKNFAEMVAKKWSTDFIVEVTYFQLMVEAGQDKIQFS